MESFCINLKFSTLNSLFKLGNSLKGVSFILPFSTPTKKFVLSSFNTLIASAPRTDAKILSLAVGVPPL